MKMIGNMTAEEIKKNRLVYPGLAINIDAGKNDKTVHIMSYIPVKKEGVKYLTKLRLSTVFPVGEEDADLKRHALDNFHYNAKKIVNRNIIDESSIEI